MALYTVSMKQLIVNSLLISIVSAAVVILFLLVKEYWELPDVYRNEKSECVKVVNYKNGDAYNCNDVNIILRKYNTKN
jgi:hypothetical protein